MRISDWSSDVCSSDLINTIAHDPLTGAMTGFNTDVEGVTGPLARSLARREATQRRALRIAIVGAGGAARAAPWGFSRLCPGAAFTALARPDEQARALPGGPEERLGGTEGSSTGP